MASTSAPSVQTSAARTSAVEDVCVPLSRVLNGELESKRCKELQRRNCQLERELEASRRREQRYLAELNRLKQQLASRSRPLDDPYSFLIEAETAPCRKGTGNLHRSRSPLNTPLPRKDLSTR